MFGSGAMRVKAFLSGRPLFVSGAMRVKAFPSGPSGPSGRLAVRPSGRLGRLAVWPVWAVWPSGPSGPSGRLAVVLAFSLYSPHRPSFAAILFLDHFSCGDAGQRPIGSASALFRQCVCWRLQKRSGGKDDQTRLLLALSLSRSCVFVCLSVVSHSHTRSFSR